jgi:hypothetical protein
MKLRSICIVTSLMLCVSPLAMAAPATQQEADRLAALFKPFMGEAAEILSVKPNGEHYDVTLDLTALQKKSDPKSPIKVPPLLLKLEDQGAGKWQAALAAPFEFSGKETKDGKETEGAVRVGGFSINGTFDQTLGTFAAAKGGLSDISFSIKEKGAGSKVHNFAFKMKDMALDLNSGLTQPIAAQADARFHISLTGISGDMDLPPDEKMPQGLKFSFALDSASRTLDLKGMRTGALTKFVTLVKKMEGKKEDDASRIETAQILRESLPLFDTASVGSTLYGLSVKTPFGDAGLSSLISDLSVNGVLPQGRAQLIVALSGLTLPAGLPQEMLPKLAVELMPQAMSIDLSVTDYDLARPVAMLLDHLEKSGEEPSPEMEQLLLAGLLPKGEVTVTLAPGSYRSPALTVGYEGSMAAGPVKMPFGQAVISAKGLDQVIELIKAAPKELELENGIYGILAAKGFGKVTEDGTVTWKIETTREGEVSVNGVKMPGTGGAD